MAVVAAAGQPNGSDGRASLDALRSGPDSPNGYIANKRHGVAQAGHTSPLRHGRVPYSTSNAEHVKSSDSPKHERRVHGSAEAKIAAHASSRRQDGSSSSDVIRSSSSRRAKEYMGEDELMALVIEMKLQAESAATKSSSAQVAGQSVGNDTSASPSGVSKTSSAPNADTIDLCHRKIQTLPADMVDIIKDDLVRLALGYNFISSLPSTFVDLTRLRYLNVRANYLTSIPDVVTRLPALEILDISRNKIRALPNEPGRLLDLRVLSISNNRLKRIPAWMADAKHLRILKIESNPLVWPPANVTTMPAFEMKQSSSATSEREKQAAFKRAEDRHMLAWINSLRGYLAEYADEAYEDGAGRPLTAVDETGEQSEAPSLSTQANATTAENREAQQRVPQDQLVSTKEPTEMASPPGLPPEEQAERQPLPAVADETLDAQDESNAQNDINGIEEQKCAEDLDVGANRDVKSSVPPPLSESLSAGPTAVPPNDFNATSTRKASADSLPGAGVSGSEDVSQGETAAAKSSESGHTASASNTSESSAASYKSGNVDQKQVPSLRSERNEPPGEAFNVTDGNEVDERSRTTNDHTIIAPDNAALFANHSRNASHTMAPPITPQRMSRIGLMRSKKSLPDLRQNHGMILMDRRAGNDIILEHDEEEEEEDSEAESESNEPREVLGAIPAASTPIRPKGARVRSSWRRSKIGADEILQSPSCLDGYTPGGSRTRGAGRNLGASSSSTATAIESERNSYFKRLSTLPASSISKFISVPVLQCVDATRGVLYALSQVHTALKHYVTFATDERMTSQLSRVLDIAGGSMANLIQSLDRFDSLSRTRGGSLDPTIVRGVLSSCIESIITFRKLVHVVHVQLKSLQAGADARYSRTLLLLLYGSLGEIAMSWSSMEPLLDEVAIYLSADLPTHHSTLPAPHLPSIAESTSPQTPASARIAVPPSRPQRRRHAGSFSAKDVAHGATMSGSLHSTPASEVDESRKLDRPPALTMASEPRILNYQAVQGAIGAAGIQARRFDGSSQMTSADSGTSRKRLPGSDEQSLANVRCAATPQGYGMYAQGMDSAALPIDDHLLMLVVKITSIAFSVWAAIEEHLVALGLPMPSSSRSHMNIQIETSGLATVDSTLSNPPISSVRALDMRMRRDNSEASIKTADSGRGHAEADTSLHETRSVNSDDNHGSAIQAKVSPTTQRKLRQLYDLMRGVHEHTHRLQACLEKAQDATALTPTSFSSPVPASHAGTSSSSSIMSSLRNGRKGGSDGASIVSGEERDVNVHHDTSAEALPQMRAARPAAPASAKSEGLHNRLKNRSIAANSASNELFSESGHFIKSVLQISHFIKSLAAEGLVLPKHVKATIAELTTCARDLTLHLHFLSGPTPLQMPMSSSASAAGHGGVRHISSTSHHSQHPLPPSTPQHDTDRSRMLPASASATTGIPTPARPHLTSLTSAPATTTIQHS